MMDRWTPIPVQRAREVRQKLKLNTYPVDTAKVVRELGIEFKEINIGADFDGCALKEEGVMGILVNAGVPYPARRNFTIAHELGHCVIETHLDPEYRCSNRNINAFDPKNPLEVEASIFAAELLMPESEFTRLAGRVPMSLAGIKEIAERFGTSLTATSIRYTRLSSDQCAIILSDCNGIIWSIRSRRFPFEIRKGPLSENSYAIDFFRGKPLPPNAQHRWLRSPHTLGKILRSKRCHHSVCNQSKNHDCQREQSSQGFLICTHPKSQLKSLL